MSEAQDSLTSGVESAPLPQDAVAVAGRLLREAREASGLHIAALAVSLKVPVNKLEALEAGRLDLLPDAVFARALASSVCRSLKVDPAPILSSLPLTRAPQLRTDAAGINAPFRAPGASATQPGWSQLLQPVPVVVALLVIGAFVLLLLPQLRWESASPSAEATTGAPPPGSDAALSAVAVQPAPGGASSGATFAGAASPAAEVAQPATPAAMSATPAAPAAVVPPPPPAAPAATAVAAAPPVGTNPVSGVVVFQPRGETWVEVKDANGVVALRKTLAAGESASVSGALPLSVVVGRADATVVEIRGKAFDLAPVSRDNVARFEVK